MISNINAMIDHDIQKVWDVVLAVDKYDSWRSDLSKTEIINDKRFVEYTKNGYATTFTVTENVIPKKWFMKPFVKNYLKKQQKQFVLDLKNALE
mgnify:CR=1 FL=1